MGTVVSHWFVFASKVVVAVVADGE